MFGQGLVPEWAPGAGVPEDGAVELGADVPGDPVELELGVVVVGAVVLVAAAAQVAAAPPPRRAPNRADAAMAVRGRIM
ncbi:MAG TPA: hypothetical protein VMT43_04125 [Acidimicrobiales bacterium]|nr:hypothetical protein [Acidimicrobiales bacterium]